MEITLGRPRFRLAAFPREAGDFCAVTIARTLPNPLLKEVLDLKPAPAGLAGSGAGQ